MGDEALLGRLGAEIAREALQEARTRARRVLVERLTRSLVEAGERSLAEPAAPAGYVFAITRADGPALCDRPGLDAGGRLRELVDGPLAAAVCDVPGHLFDGLADEPIDAGSRLALLASRHDEIVREVFERRPVLPLRFGTVLASQRDVSAVLGGGRERFLAELGRVEGRAEWTCTSRPTASPPSRTRPAPSPPSFPGSPSTWRDRSRHTASRNPWRRVTSDRGVRRCIQILYSIRQ